MKILIILITTYLFSSILAKDAASENVRYFLTLDFYDPYDYKEGGEFRDEVKESEISHIKNYYRVSYVNKRRILAELILNSDVLERIEFDNFDRITSWENEIEIKEWRYEKSKIRIEHLNHKNELQFYDISEYSDGRLWKTTRFNKQEDVQSYIILDHDKSIAYRYNSDGKLIEESSMIRPGK